MITSTNNARIKNIIKLQKSSRERIKQNVFVAEGIKIFSEARIYGRIREVYVSESFMALYGELLEKGVKNISPKENSLQARIQEQMIQAGADWLAAYNVEVIQDTIFSQVSETVTPQGIVSLVEIPEYELEEMVENEENKKTLLLLDGIQDPGNLGTILRTAEAAGIAGVLMSKDTVDVFNPKVVRATMGGIFRVPHLVCESLNETIGKLKEDGYTVYGAALEDGAKEYTEITYEDKAAVVIGNEAKGISESVLKVLDKKLIIPMEGQVESLNAAVAAAIFMFEIARQRRNL